MPRFPVREQTTRPSAGRASPEHFGAIEGQAKQQTGAAVTELGGTILAIEERKRTRQETIERVRNINSFSQAADQEFTRIQTEEDLTDPQTLEKFNSFLRDNINSAKEGHQASPESRDELTRLLETQQSDYAKAAYKASVSAQFKLIGSHMDSTISGLSDQAAQAPELFLENLIRMNDEVSKMAPALTPDQEDSFRRIGKSEIVNSTVQSYLNSGNIEAAKGILGTKGLVEDLSPDAMRQLRQNIVIEERKLERIDITRRRRLDEASTVMGTTMDKLTSDQKLRASFLPAIADMDDRSLMQVISEFESVKGSPATEAEMTKLETMHQGRSMSFGNSLDGRILTTMNELTPGLATGQLDGNELRNLDAAVTHYTQPRQYQNPTTGLMETRQNRLPPHVLQAYTAAGRTPPVGSVPSGLPEPTAVLDTPPENPDQTVWARRSNLVGPMASLQRGAGRIPGLGGLTGGGGEPAEDRQYAELRQKTLVTALQDSPRFAEGEREYLNETFSITGGVVDTQQAWEKRAFAIDDYLSEEIKRAMNDINSPETTVQIRQAALADLKTISNFREHFGAPRRYKPEEVKELPEGAEFYGMDGILRRKRKRQGTP